MNRNLTNKLAVLGGAMLLASSASAQENRYHPSYSAQRNLATHMQIIQDPVNPIEYQKRRWESKDSKRPDYFTYDTLRGAYFPQPGQDFARLPQNMRDKREEDIIGAVTDILGAYLFGLAIDEAFKANVRKVNGKSIGQAADTTEIGDIVEVPGNTPDTVNYGPSPTPGGNIPTP